MGDLAEWLDARAAARNRAGLTRSVRPRRAIDPTLDLASNDYLGLARDPRLAAAAATAAAEWGVGATGSRLVTGTTSLHQDLERSLARHVGGESALVFSSGYLANLGLITSLAGPDCLIVSDAQNHASLIDACRLTRSRVIITPHRDNEAVGRALAARHEVRALVITDAVFSVDGDLTDLARLHQVARGGRAMLIVDEAHAFGVIGSLGAGACAEAGIAGEPDVAMTVTLSKALGSQGGAVIGPARLTTHLVSTARSFIFDTALAPPLAAAALRAVEVLADEPELPGRALARAADLQASASDAGWRTPRTQGAVFSALTPGPAAAAVAAEVCLEHGVRVGCFRPPSVPDEFSRLRITARADLTEGDVTRAADAMASAARRIGIG